jgi:radical SAM additional 4Fe4S-binding domain
MISSDATILTNIKLCSYQVSAENIAKKCFSGTSLCFSHSFHEILWMSRCFQKLDLFGTAVHYAILFKESVQKMNTISILIKPASSSCNLKCKYCFYEDEAKARMHPSFPVMKEDTVNLLAQRADEALGHKGTANIGFQGGEPTVAGIDFFRKFVQIFEKHPEIEVHYSMQTNGTLLNDAWAQFLYEHHFLVGISLDGYETNMDLYRYDAEKQSVYFKVLAGIDCLKKANVDYNILTVVTKSLAEHPEALLKFYLDHHFEYVQLIPCLPGINGSEDAFSLQPNQYSEFYIRFFDAWKKAFLQGKHISINLFENIAGMLMGQAPYQCGMNGKCFIQYVIESNGDVFPCDFYCLDEVCLGNLKDLSFAELASSHNAMGFLSHSNCTKKPCASCPLRQYCNGGCRRQNVCYLTDESCAYQKFLLHVIPELQEMLSK